LNQDAAKLNENVVKLSLYLDTFSK
jgi:hypothetical protein